MRARIDEAEAEILAMALGTSVERIIDFARRGGLRVMGFRGLKYYALRRGFAGFEEGTSIFIHNGGFVVVPGYPAIKRMLLLDKAIPRWFKDRVIVEEKMNGYNVRVTSVGGRIVAITRGGLVCPYTTTRLERMYGARLRELFSEYDEIVLAGEVVGLENPYTRYYYPEAPRFDYFVFDVFVKGRISRLKMRDELVEKYGLRRVPILAETSKDDIEGIRRVVSRLEQQGREGIVVKDPEYRVPPLKYTTSRTNISDIRTGMRFFFEEGRSFLFSRVLREIFKLFEEGVIGNKVYTRAVDLGLAILEPAIETVHMVSKGKPVLDEFELVFTNQEELQEFIDYMSQLGIDLIVSSQVETRDGIRVKMAKPKDTWIEVKRILETGLSPLD